MPVTPHRYRATNDLLFVEVTDGTAAGPATVSAVATLPTVSLNGSSYVPVSCHFLSTSYPTDWVVFALPWTVAEGDVVLVTHGNTAINTTAGFLAAVTAAVVTNDAGGNSLLPSTLDPSRSMKVGYMFNASTPQPGLLANLIKGAAAGWSFGGNAFNGAYDANDYPASGSAYKFWMDVSTASGLISGGNAEYRYALPGDYTVTWDGAAAAVDLYISGVLQVPSASSTGHATGNYKTCKVSLPSGHYSFQGSVNVDTAGGPITDLGVYGPDVADPFGPPFLSPTVRARLAGTKVWRAKDYYQDINFAAHTSASFAPPSAACYDRIGDLSVEVTGISAAPNPMAWNRGGEHGAYLQCNKAHGLAGCTLISLVWPGGGTPTFTHTITYADATTESLYWGGLQVRDDPAGDPTKLLWLRTPAEKAVAAADYSALNPIVYFQKPCPPMEDAWKVSNAIDGLEILWLTLPAALDDAAVTAWAAEIAAHLTAGIKVLIEYANEVTWNPLAGYFYSYRYVFNAGRELGLSNYEWYALRARQCFDLFKAAWVGGGRSAADLIFTLAGQAADANKAAAILDYATTHKADGTTTASPTLAITGAMGGFSVAAYNGAVPVDVGDFDALTEESRRRIIDMGVLHFPTSVAGSGLAAHRALLDSYPALTGKPLYNYEGGWTNFKLGDATDHGSLCTVALSLHPDSYLWELALLKGIEAYNTTVHIQNGLYSVFGVEGSTECLMTLAGLDMIPGRGDGSDGLPDNRDQVVSGADVAAPDLTRCVSPRALALLRYAGAAAESAARTVFAWVVGTKAYVIPVASPSALTAPLSPAAVTNATHSADVSWQESLYATGYTVGRATVSGGPYTTAGTSSTTSFSDSGLTNDTPYFYVVKATRGAAVSDWSTEASVTPMSSPLLTGLRAFWQFDEASGDILDSVHTSHLVGSGSPGAASGLIGGARTFTSAGSQYASCASNVNINASPAFTAAIWVKFSAVVTAAANSFIFGKWASFGSGDWIFSTNGNGSGALFLLGVRLSDGSFHSCTAGSYGDVVAGRWYLLVMRANADQIKFDVRGPSGYSPSFSQSFGGGLTLQAGSDALYASSNPGDANYIDGTLDEGAVWQRALGDAEVTLYYNAGAGRTYPDFA